MTTPDTTPSDSTDLDRIFGKFDAERLAESVAEVMHNGGTVAVAARQGASDDGDDEDEDIDVPPIPECPDCGGQDARQLSTGEWVCQECTAVYERGDA